MLLVEQNAPAALRLADRSYVLENGRVALAGRASELMADSPVQRVYVGQTLEEGRGRAAPLAQAERGDAAGGVSST